MKKTIAILLVLSLTVLSLVGCSSNATFNTDSGAICLSVVVANNETFAAISSTTVKSIYEEVYNTCESGINFTGGSVSLVVADGAPYICFDEKIDTIETNITQAKRESEAEVLASQIIREAASAQPKTSEIDMLQSLNIASRTVNTSNAERKQILVYANGLQTTGILNMTTVDVLNSDFSVICEDLINKNAIYDYKGIEFVWVGMGCTSATSKQHIPNSAVKKLENLWTSIIEAGGGTVSFKPDFITGDSLDVNHNVSLVNFPEDKLDTVSIDTLDNGIKLDGETLKFKGDLAEFVDYKTAKNTLTPIAEQIKESGIKILIAGTTASSGSEDSCYKLSLDRAQACKDLLVELGVSEKQICTVGLGRKPCFLRVTDIDSNGNFIEAEAQKNRAVFIYNYDSDTAKEIIRLSV